LVEVATGVIVFAYWRMPICLADQCSSTHQHSIHYTAHFYSVGAGGNLENHD